MVEVTWNGTHLHEMSFDESDFVKNLRETHCKGCRDENSPRKCGACAVLDCWLRRTYLPAGEWAQACRADILNEQVDNISEAINKEISKELLEKYGKETEK